MILIKKHLTMPKWCSLSWFKKSNPPSQEKFSNKTEVYKNIKTFFVKVLNSKYFQKSTDKLKAPSESNENSSKNSALFCESSCDLSLLHTYHHEAATLSKKLVTKCFSTGVITHSSLLPTKNTRGFYFKASQPALSLNHPVQSVRSNNFENAHLDDHEIFKIKRNSSCPHAPTRKIRTFNNFTLENNFL